MSEIGDQTILVYPTATQVVWDARVVHCSAGVAKNLPLTHALRGPDAPPLARLVAYVAMMPRSRLNSHIAKKRRTAVLRGTGSGWNPLVMRDSKIARDYRPPAPADPRWALV